MTQLQHTIYTQLGDKGALQHTRYTQLGDKGRDLVRGVTKQNNASHDTLAFGVQAGHLRANGALGNERNIFVCAEKDGFDLGIGREPGTGLPGLLEPPLPPPLTIPNGLAGNMPGRETPRHSLPSQRPGQTGCGAARAGRRHSQANPRRRPPRPARVATLDLTPTSLAMCCGHQILCDRRTSR